MHVPRYTHIVAGNDVPANWLTTATTAARANLVPTLVKTRLKVRP